MSCCGYAISILFSLKTRSISNRIADFTLSVASTMHDPEAEVQDKGIVSEVAEQNIRRRCFQHIRIGQGASYEELPDQVHVAAVGDPHGNFGPSPGILVGPIDDLFRHQIGIRQKDGRVFVGLSNVRLRTCM